MGNTIYLSPSAQENNVGVGDFGTEEYRMNRITDILEAILINEGYIVYRNNPEDSLTQIVEESNEIGPDIHVAIHSNAANGLARGPEIYTNMMGTPGDRLAHYIYNQILEIYPNPELGRGVKYTDSLYEIVQTNAPAVLLEIAFHDNIEDAEFIMQNETQIAEAIARGINQFFG